MGIDTIIKWSNRIALFAITLLMYWVFVFISVTVFGFKVFREKITETFALSIVGILGLLLGALVVNIMFNLTKISAAAGRSEPASPPKKFGKIIIAFLISFPLLFGFLFLGDKCSSIKKEKMIKAAAQSLVEENQQILRQFSEYIFDWAWLNKAGSNLVLLEKVDENFPGVRLIVQDEIDGKTVFLEFAGYFYNRDNLKKTDYIYSCSAEERAYLAAAFKGNIENRFSANNGRYELYYPVKTGAKIIVLYLSEYQRYGKMGS